MAGRTEQSQRGEEGKQVKIARARWWRGGARAGVSLRHSVRVWGVKHAASESAATSKARKE